MNRHVGSRSGIFRTAFDLLLGTGPRRIRVMLRCAMYAEGKGWLKAQRAFLLWIERSFGVYISPGAKFSGIIRFAHPTGVVIGCGVQVGRNVTIYQQVTLGALGGGPGEYPVVCDGVTIYAGAKILGPVTLGEGCVVGANAVVLTSVPAGGVAVGVPARIINNQDGRNGDE